MNRTTRSVITSLAVTACLSQMAATHAQAAPPSETMLTVDQVRSSFASAGFQVDPARNWDWTSPPVSTFQVHDQANGRVLLALVYTTSASAQTARLQAQMHEQELNPGNVTASGYGPHLVPEFGLSVWRGNVALVQTTQSELARIFQLQNECDSGVLVDTNALHEPAPANAVDLDFQQALDNRAVTF